MTTIGNRSPGARGGLSLPRLWAIVTITGILIILNLWLVRPHDFWWHVRVGEWIVQNGRVPAVDHFSFTQSGEPYIYQMWLSEVVMYLLHRVGGLPLVIFLNAVVITAAYALLLRVNLRAAGGNLRWASLATLAAAAPGVDSWNVRPQTLSYPFFALVLYLLARNAARSRAKGAWHRRLGALWCLPPLFAVWANCHGGFVFGLVLLGCYLLSLIIAWLRRDRAFPTGVTVIAGLSAISTLLTPHGVGIIDYLLGLFRNPVVRQWIVEWMPPTVRTPTGLLFFGFLFVLIGLLVATHYRPSVYQTTTLLVFGVMALMASRNVPWFGFVAAPTVAAALGYWSRGRKSTRTPSSGARTINRVVLVTVVLLAVLSLPWLRRYLPLPPVRQAYVSPDTPEEAVRFVSAMSPRPRVFHAEGFGSYMTWASPGVPVFIDTRFELYPQAQWQDYLAVSYARHDWEAILDRYGVDTLMLGRVSQVPLIEAASATPGWAQIYEDDLVVVFRQTEIP